MKKYKLGDLLSEFHAGKAIQIENIKNKGAYPVYGGNGQRGYTDSYNQDGEYLIIGRQGAYCGNVRYNIGKAYLTEHAIVGQTREDHNPIYIALKLSLMKLSQLQGQSAQPGLSVNTLSCISMEMPPKEIQDKIADIILKLDRKIELNRQINDNLEAMAKQLYDYWFVQFDFPNEEGKPYKSSGGAMVWNEKLKRKIPNGWTVETVGTYANCKSGYAIKSSDFKAKGIPVIKIGNIQEDYTLNMNGCQYIENNANKLFYVYQNDVVIAMTGATIGKFAIVPYSETGYFVNQRVGKFELGNNPIKKMPYLINSLKIDYFRNQIFQLASGCAQPNISAEQINNISLLYPSTKILSEYNMKCKWMYEQIANCRYQIDVLTKLRDKLLPLLMNGQASVNYHLYVYLQLIIYCIFPHVVKINSI